jgi:hypothetical protein
MRTSQVQAPDVKGTAGQHWDIGAGRKGQDQLRRLRADA